MSFTTPADVEGRTVVTRDGDKIGKVDTVFLDVRTNTPEWAAVSTGMFGKHVSLLPLSAASVLADGNLQVPFDKAKVKGAPHHDPGADLKMSDEAELFRYYGVAYGDGGAGDGGMRTGTSPAFETGGEPSTFETHGGPMSPEAGRDETDRRGPTGGREAAAGGAAASAGATGQSRREIRDAHPGRTRLRKYVVTEQVTLTVPVSHEEVRVERIPSGESRAASGGTGFGNESRGDDGRDQDDDEVVVLHAERPVVHKETVVVERVRLDSESVGEDEAG